VPSDSFDKPIDDRQTEQIQKTKKKKKKKKTKK
jgi:hypothetical protein